MYYPTRRIRPMEVQERVPFQPILSQTLDSRGKAISPESTLPPRGARTVLYLLVLVLAGLVGVVPFCLRRQSDWYNVYVPAAERLLAGENIFEQGFVYPPLAACLAVPWIVVPPIVGKVLWYLTSLVSLYVLCRVAWHLTGGKRLGPLTEPDRREHAVAILGSAFGVSFAVDSICNHQNDVLVVALVVVGCFLMHRSRWIGGAAIIGLAAGLKCTPLLFAPYLICKGRWNAAATVVGVALMSNFLPDAFIRPNDGESRLGRFGNTLLAPMVDREHRFGTWAASIESNHSLSGVGNRLLGFDSPGPRLPAVQRASYPSPETVRLWYLLTAGSCIVMACLTQLRRKGDIVAEFGIVLALMPLLSPHSSKGHFCTLIVPGLYLARLAVYRRDLVSRICVGIVVLLTVLKTATLVGRPISHWLFWYGGIPAGTVVLLIGSVQARLRGVISEVEVAAQPQSDEMSTHLKEMPIQRAA